MTIFENNMDMHRSLFAGQGYEPLMDIPDEVDLTWLEPAGVRGIADFGRTIELGNHFGDADRQYNRIYIGFTDETRMNRISTAVRGRYYNIKEMIMYDDGRILLYIGLIDNNRNEIIRNYGAGARNIRLPSWLKYRLKAEFRIISSGNPAF